ncbi:MAG: efflux RND transporter periplasmic adaptor subunit [Candidatus Methylacidiphilales bacterium]|nr:efflux RND transporter periplasmic adaptor subunit [Candidatus Methylacidiphilales bacterium]
MSPTSPHPQTDASAPSQPRPNSQDSAPRHQHGDGRADSEESDEHGPESEPHESLTHTASLGRNLVNWVIIGAVIAGVGAALWFGAIVPSLNSKKETARKASDPGGLRVVNVMQPTPSPATTTLILPGTVRAWQQADLFARTNGYLQKWNVDIGDPVKEGQVLAIIDTPEIDQELKGAMGDLAQAQANYDLAAITERRWKELLDGKVSTPQEYDEKAGALRARDADLSAAKAKVSRLQDLQAFQKVVAPFSGIVTTRNAQVGALINSGSSSGVPLFTIVQINRLRVSVRVPQSYVRSIRNGLEADLLVPEFRDRTFGGKVSRSANAIDDATRTLLTEVEVPNADGTLLPGMYANVRFAMKDPQPPMLLPANTLQFRPDGPQVLVLDKDSKVEPRRVKLGRDYGAMVEVTSGVQLVDRVIANPTYELVPGLQVDARLLPASDLKTAALQALPGAQKEINFKAEKSKIGEPRPIPLLPPDSHH